MNKLIPLLLLLMAGIAQAQTIEDTLDISWTNPTEGCVVGAEPPQCGPLTEPLSAINIWVSKSPITDQNAGAPTIVVGGNATSATHTLTVSNGETIYVRAKAVLGTQSSAFSEEVTKVISLALQPGAPGNIQLRLNIVL